ncbi:hypothetical protein [Paenibacillus sp. UMB4589-SE434]|uniref:hypothetical protein n=1 Tax=Paenibacillus sp. UMB4589-SE434 TaxID=3046314 RepID=UPI00254C17A9|nr:hypothetical protein [Paenibacillus sp. UMB4589-SE434]MDK8180296.1 hypothetical protein [Paenibacillus sp. UMB4589-SE434]
MPLIPRYSTIDTAAVTFTGQHCSGSADNLTTPYTTLELLPECDILHAELTWFASFTTGVDMKEMSDLHVNRVNLGTPIGYYQINEQGTNYIVQKGQASHCICSADLTSIVTEWKSGTYSVTIPAWESIHSMLQCGWVLHVIIKHPSLPLQYINLVTGHEHVSQHKSHHWKLTGFRLPSTNIKFNLWLCAANAQALTGDIGSYYATRTPMNDAQPVLNPAWMRQLQASPLQLTNPSFENQLICVCSVPQRTEWSDIFTMAVQLDSDGALIKSCLNRLGEYIDYQYGEIELYELQLFNEGNQKADSILASFYATEGGILLKELIGVLNQSAPTVVSCKSGIVTISDLLPNETVTIRFPVVIDEQLIDQNELPRDLITCVASITYTFEVSLTRCHARTISNYVNIPVPNKQSNLNVTQYADVTSARLQDSITFNVQIASFGHRKLSNVFFRDMAYHDCYYVPGTLTVNGQFLPDADPLAGFYLYKIDDCITTLIRYDLKLQHIPPNSQLQTAAQINYSFFHPNGCTGPNYTIRSQTTTVWLHYAQIYRNLLMKSKGSNIGDVVDLILRLSNGGNETAEQVPVYLSPAPGMSFVEDSVIIDRRACPNKNPYKGFHLDHVKPNRSLCIQFKARITRIEALQHVRNQAVVPYTYQIASDQPSISVSQPSNMVTTYIHNLNISLTKKVTRKYAAVGDQLVYTLQVSNRGHTSIIGATVRDILEPWLTLVPGTVTVNGLKRSHCDLQTGCHLGQLSRGTAYTITFAAVVTALPPNGRVYNQAEITYQYVQLDPYHLLTKTSRSNRVYTIVQHVDVSLNKQTCTRLALVGDIIRFTHHIINIGNTTLGQVWFADPLATPLQVVTASVRVDGVPAPKLDPQNGFRLASLRPKSETWISLLAEVTNITTNQLICSSAWINYAFHNDSCEHISYNTAQSNAAPILVQASLLDMCMSVDQDCVQVGEQLTYTIVLRNAALVPLSSIYYVNPLPADLCFIPGSLRINGKAYHPFVSAIRLHLDTLQPGASLVVSYRCQVSKEALDSRQLLNSAEAEFYMPRYGQSCTIKRNTSSNTVSTRVYRKCLLLFVACSHKYVTSGVQMKCEVAVSNAGTITADDVWFYASIPAGLHIVAGSLLVNDERWTEACPGRGFSLGTLSPSTTVKITYVISAEDITSAKVCLIQSKLHCVYRPLMTSCSEQQTITKADPILIYILPPWPNQNPSKATPHHYGAGPAKLILQLMGGQSEAGLCQPIRYAVRVTNVGYTFAEHVRLVLTLPREASRIQAWISDKSSENEVLSAPDHVPIPRILPGEDVVVHYEIELSELPRPNCLRITAAAFYQTDHSFFKTPTNTYHTSSNCVITIIQHYELAVCTSVYQDAAAVGELLPFHTIIHNQGTIKAVNIHVSDLLSSPRWEVESAQALAADQICVLPDGLNITHLEPGASCSLFHETEITTPLTSAWVTNQVQIHYDSNAQYDEDAFPRIAVGNKVHIYVKHHGLQIRSVPATSSCEADNRQLIIVTINNVGGGTAYNLNITSILPAELRSSVSTTLLYDNSLDIYPATARMLLPVLQPDRTAIIKYSVNRHAYKDQQPIDNNSFETVATYYYSDDSNSRPAVWEHDKVKSTYRAREIKIAVCVIANCTSLEIGDTLSFTIVVENSGNHAVFGLLLYVSLPELVWMVDGADIIWGCKQQEHRVELGQLAVGHTRRITFSAANIHATRQQLDCRARAVCYYQFPDSSIIHDYEAVSNDAIVQLSTADIELYQRASALEINCGEYVKLSIQIKNTGNIDLTDVWLYEACSPQLTLVPGSVMLNNNCCPDFVLQHGIFLGKLATSKHISITLLVAAQTRPRAGYVTCRSQVGFRYRVQQAQNYRTRTYQSNIIKIYVQ